MKILIKDKKSFTLAEILISALILVIAAAGVFSSFIAANRYVNMSKRRMAAVNLARQVSERLYPRVSADTWTDGVNNLLTCPPGTSNNDYPCNKTVPGPPGPLAEYSIDASNPLANYSPTVTLTIDLVGDKVGNPNCFSNCPRNVSIGVSWNE